MLQIFCYVGKLMLLTEKQAVVYEEEEKILRATMNVHQSMKKSEVIK